jgi:hypothetical protein
MVKKSRWTSRFGVLGMHVSRFEHEELCQNRAIRGAFFCNHDGPCRQPLNAVCCHVLGLVQLEVNRYLVIYICII